VYILYYLYPIVAPCVLLHDKAIDPEASIYLLYLYFKFGKTLMCDLMTSISHFILLFVK